MGKNLDHFREPTKIVLMRWRRIRRGWALYRRRCRVATVRQARQGAVVEMRAILVVDEANEILVFTLSLKRIVTCVVDGRAEVEHLVRCSAMNGATVQFD